MSEHSQAAIDDLDGYLAEIDRRLHRVQLELVAGEGERAGWVSAEAGPAAGVPAAGVPAAGVPAEAGPAAEEPADAGPRSAVAGATLAALAAAADQRSDSSRQLQAKLIAAMRDLIEAFESAQAQRSAAGVTMSAGPFATLAALREFEHALAALPGVREVSIRGYEGTDRAILDVRLGGTASAADPG